MHLQSQVSELLEQQYFPMVVYESMINAHKLRINEGSIQPFSSSFVNQIMDYRSLAAQTMKFSQLTAPKLHLELFGASLLDSFRKNYAKMLF